MTTTQTESTDPTVTAPDRVLVTPDAAEVMRKVQADNGPIMFHQSGGCCDGSSPMCYGAKEFMVGDRDILLGMLLPGEPEAGSAGTPVWISGSQFVSWKHTQLILDVVPGRGGGFSLEAPSGVRFLTRGRVFTAAEQQALDAAGTMTGADIDAGKDWPTPATDTLASEELIEDVCRVR